MCQGELFPGISFSIGLTYHLLPDKEQLAEHNKRLPCNAA
jgi:hypothetical protein